MASIWFLIARTMAIPPPLTSRMIHVGFMDPQQARELEQELMTIDGIAESVIVAEEGIAYLKVDSRIIDSDRLQEFIAPEHRDDDSGLSPA